MTDITYIKLKTSILNPRYELIYLDTPDYLADNIFVNYNIKSIKIKNEFQKNDEKYVIIRCSIKKKDYANFIIAMEELQNKMLLCGHREYPDFCRGFIAALKKGA